MNFKTFLETVNKSDIPAYLRKNDKMTTKDLEKERTQNRSHPETIKKINGTQMEEVEQIEEANHREFASQGKMHPDMAKHMKTGEHMDYYEPKTGDKVHGKVMKNDGKEVHVKQTHDSYNPKKVGTVHKFTIASKLEEGWYEKPASAYRRKGDEIGGGSSTNFSPNSRATLSRKDNVPFDGPYTKVKGDVKDKSGAVHSPMSRAKHLAKMAMKKSMKEDIDRLFEKDDSEYNYEGEMAVTQLKTISRHAEALQAKMKPDTNLPEWVQSKITLATDYMQTAHDYLMSELDEQAPVAPVPGMKFKNQAVMVHPETKSRVVINRKNIDNYTSDGYKEVRPGQKLKEDEEVKFSYTELMMINEIKLADLPVRRVKGHSYGADYSDPEGADDMWDKESLKKPTAEKRGRGRPAGSQSGARKNYGSSKLHTK